jgi:hypothetical protein
MRILIFSILSLVVISSCKKKQISKTEDLMVSGSWKISSYTDDGANETSDYSSYTFIFNEDGTVNANGASIGTWSIAKESSSGDDDSSSDNHLHFNLNLSIPFDDLSDDWEIENKSDSSIELKDVSGGNGGEDNLVFTKI